MAVESSQIRNRHNQNLALMKLITSANRIWQPTTSEVERGQGNMQVKFLTQTERMWRRYGCNQRGRDTEREPTARYGDTHGEREGDS